MNKSHLLPPRIELFGYGICPYVMRVRYVLALLDLDHHYVELDIYKAKPAALLRYNPLGRVPTLVVDNDSICDSTVIALWLAQVYREYKLLPVDAWSQAKVMNDMAAIDFVHSKISTLMGAADQAAFTASLDALSESLQAILPVLNALNSNQVSLTHVWVMPLALLLKTLDQLFDGQLSDAIAAIRSLPNLQLAAQSPSAKFSALLPVDYAQQLSVMLSKRSRYYAELLDITMQKECAV
ncbi:glutathione S-transferase family protein [Pseudoalteromonas sp. JBTF-M23]|uniref:Glutathione S-transferase family protein n=1 Tax=Pseudoalteromonas caenipelagi TaxID=2726988 RepID=A0A849VDI2_9GAMM|nr:glutathione S-transferase family protein [Pseudoalteromonas caenipelagi]NOU51356.1 glutathione S-transferase family protein [Pseudoalteromonas caenipelagi]